MSVRLCVHGRAHFGGKVCVEKIGNRLHSNFSQHFTTFISHQSTCSQNMISAAHAKHKHQHMQILLTSVS